MDLLPHSQGPRAGRREDLGQRLDGVRVEVVQHQHPTLRVPRAGHELPFNPACPVLANPGLASGVKAAAG